MYNTGLSRKWFVCFVVGNVVYFNVNLATVNKQNSRKPEVDFKFSCYREEIEKRSNCNEEKQFSLLYFVNMRFTVWCDPCFVYARSNCG